MQHPATTGLPRSYAHLGIQVPTVYLPGSDVDMSCWAVVACDQYTSQPEYWQAVEGYVGDAPSTLNLILPEFYLGKSGEAEQIQKVQSTMSRYMDDGLLDPSTGMMYVERTIAGKTRCGLVLCLDLERYDFTKGSFSLIRATEGTIIERLPPRMKIRRGALLELPHILVLIDDPQRTVIEPLAAAKDRLVGRYDFHLMMGGGHLAGWQVQDLDLEAQIVQALQGLADPQVFRKKYELHGEYPVLLYAMGDGNHSLATAKAIWEELKPNVAPDHPARYALVEIENVHDPALEFEPIHRVLFGMQSDFFAKLGDFFGESITWRSVADCEELAGILDTPSPGAQTFGVTIGGQCYLVEVRTPPSNLAVGTIQPFLDQLIKSGEARSIDYVHGNPVVFKLTESPQNVGIFLPHMRKSDLFKTVILDGALPRKTFSMGEAHEKRYYVEARRIA